MMAEKASPFLLEQRFGYGCLQAAGWLDNSTVVMATQAALWRWEPMGGQVTAFAALGAGLLHINWAAGLAAVTVECPKRALAVISLADGRVVQLPAHGGKLVHCIAISPDGRFLASGGTDRMLRIREIASGAEVLTLEHPGGFSSMDGNPDVVAWSPDGTRLATADNQKRLWLWDSVSGTRRSEWRLPLQASALAFSPDGQILVAGLKFGGGTISRNDRFLVALSAWTGEILHTLDTPTEENRRGDNVWAVAYSPDGRFCAAGDEEGAVHVFEAGDWQRIAHLPEAQHRIGVGKRVTISGLDYSPDGRHLLVVVACNVNRGSGAVEYALEIWDTLAWALTARLDDFVGAVNDLSLLPDGNILAATDEGLRRYTADGKYTTVRPGNIHRVAASPDGHYAVVSYHSFDGRAGLLDLHTGACEEPLPAITQELINSVAFLSDSQRYLICHSNYWLRKVGRATALKKLSPQEIKPRNCLAATASSDGKMAIVSWQGTLLVLWGDKLEHSTPWLAHPADRSRANAADFAPPTWAGTPMPGADFRDFPTWQTYADDCRRLNAAAFSPGGDLLAVASGFHQRGRKPLDALGRIYIWRLADWHTRELVTPDENRWFEAVAWSPDGGLIAGGTRNGMICLFDAQSGEFLSEFLAHGAPITALDFMRNGSALVTAAKDGSIGVWRR